MSSSDNGREVDETLVSISFPKLRVGLSKEKKSSIITILKPKYLEKVKQQNGNGKASTCNCFERTY